ncbi:MAG: DinB family protein, partial [Bacteroidota bacterium]
FDERFYPPLGIEPRAMAPVLEDFYDNAFPALRALTGMRPEAADLVRWALARGDTVGIATDPLFPLKATHHRLRFAGLAPEEYGFALVSSYETFHFTKSHPAYYAEFLGRLGWPDGPILMVGNDLDRDLAPARALGLATYWVHGEDVNGAQPDAAAHGSLSQLRTFLETVDLRMLEPQFTRRDSNLALMMAAPAAISSLSEEMPPDQWSTRPEPGEWALTEVLCHLRDTEVEVNQPRLQTLLDEDHPFIAARNTDQWAQERSYLSQDGRDAFRDYLAARRVTLEKLDALKLEDWGRSARHSIFGPTTLLEMVGFMATHDRIHIQQIWKLLHPAS